MDFHRFWAVFAMSIAFYHSFIELQPEDLGFAVAFPVIASLPGVIGLLGVRKGLTQRAPRLAIGVCCFKARFSMGF